MTSARPRLPARRLAPLALALLAALAAGACEYDRTVIDQGQPRLAVHAVLNPGGANQYVLVEQVLTGRVNLFRSGFDPLDPIVSGGGDPVAGARVVLYGPEEGDSSVAVEELGNLPLGRGAGVYRMLSPGIPCGLDGDQCLYVRPGGRYRLRVTTSQGEVTGTTTVPDVQPLRVHPQPQQFDRESDSVTLVWAGVPTARRYALRIETPRGPFTAFLSDTSYRLAGLLRNPLEPTLPSVFMPGFVQSATVAAVDSNYYDYFRSSNNPFTGTGLINRLEGGIGVFGSWVLVHEKALSVVAPEDEPIEGRYERAAAAVIPAVMRLWVESEASGTSYLSGRYQHAGDFATHGVLGLRAGTSVTLAFLADQLASDTALVFRGQVQADGSLLGCAEGPASAPGTPICGQRFSRSP
ncbi:MAG: hypothetical protein ACJ8AO_22245 [Gemmatimonadaceae bacterium]